MSRKKLTEIHLVSYTCSSDTGIKLEVEAWISKYGAKTRRATLLGTIGAPDSKVQNVNEVMKVRVM